MHRRSHSHCNCNSSNISSNKRDQRSVYLCCFVATAGLDADDESGWSEVKEEEAEEEGVMNLSHSVHKDRVAFQSRHLLLHYDLRSSS